jgi:hypothetical protein
MSATLVIPIIIQGPAYVGHGGVVYYVESDITVEETVESWTPKTTFGDAGQRHKSRVFKVTSKPVGMLAATLLDYFYEAHLAPQTYIGRSIFPASNAALTIYSIAENKTYAFVNASMPSPPDLYCGPGKTAFGSMSHWCIGAPATAPTSVNFMKAASGALGTADTSFDASKIHSDIYQGALGALTTPYNSLGAMDGFAFKFGWKPKNIPAADVGIADIILDSDGFNVSAQFAPSNLTEAHVDTLLGYQDTGAVLPGQAYGGAAKAGNLVLTGINFGWVFTAYALGAKSAKRIYKIGEHRFPNGAVEMVNQMLSTSGVPGPLFGFTAGT